MPGQLAMSTPWSAQAWLWIVLGTLIVLGTASSVLRTLVVTRGLDSIIARTLQAIPASVLRFFARRLQSYNRRDYVLSWVPSLSIMAMLLGWLAMFLVGYSLILYGTSELAFWDSVRQAGSSLFTLGFASSQGVQLTIVDFVAAATGPIVIGLMIGYLPTLYTAYNRRELDVALLKSRAGEPNWGPEILARASMAGSLDDLDLLWPRWEEWSANVSESHSTYPILIFTRSARPDRNWIIAQLAVLDAAAMRLALNPSENQSGPRLCLRQGVECIRDLARATNIPFDPDPSLDTPISLTFEDFAEAVATLDRAGYPHERSAERAWKYFRQWRVVYEEPATKLALLLDAVPAMWSGPRIPPTEQVPPHRPRYIINNPDGSLGVVDS